LDRLLKQVAPQHTLDDLLSALRLIIRDEKATLESTRKWGAQLYQSPAAAEKERRPIAERQNQIADRAGQFQERLLGSLAGETDPAFRAGLEKAGQLLQQNPVGPLLANAATDITQRRPVPAVAKQTEALQVLEAIEKLLQPDNLRADLDAMQEMRAQLETLLKDQEALRQRTDAVPPAEFDAAKLPLQAAERELVNRLTTIQTNAPPPVSDTTRGHLDTANQHMQSAENQIAQTRQAPAVQSQRQAEAALKQALAALEQDIAALEQLMQPQEFPDLADLAQQALELAEHQRALREETARTETAALPKQVPPQNQLAQRAQALNQQLPLPQFQTAVSQMQMASDQLQQSRQSPAMQHQANAEQALRDAAQALTAAQQAMDLASQQYDLMQQTGATPADGLPQLTPPQSALGQQAAQFQFQQAAGFMQQAGQSLQQSQGQQAMGQQQSAINSLIGQAAEALGMEPGMLPGLGLMPGFMPGFGFMPGLMATHGFSLNPREFGNRYFGRQNAGRTTASSGDARWGTLPPAEREARVQKFARELPLEFREVVEAYFEALAK
jgi:hypothetical protein